MKLIALILLIVLSFGFLLNQFFDINETETYKELGKINQYTVYKYEPEFCATALDVIYEDDEFVYYFTCIKSENYVIKYNQQSIGLKDALQKNLITIQELIQLEPSIVAHPKSDWYNSHIPASEYLIIYNKI